MDNQSYHKKWYQEHKKEQNNTCKEYYNNHIKELRESSRLRQLKLRIRAIEKLGGKCIRCGYDIDLRGLCVDHINGGGTKEESNIGTQGIYRKVLKDPTGYQCLCATCNQIKRIEEHEN
jgi:hypothetical protein